MRKKIWLLLFLLFNFFSFGNDSFYIKEGEEELSLESTPKNIVTDSAILSRFFDALGIDLVGVPSSTTKIPERYKSVTRIGRAGMPDLEVIKSLNTELVVGTIFSKPTIKPKYDSLNIPSFYLDVDTYDKSKEVVSILGEAFHKEKEAEAIMEDWNQREKLVIEKASKQERKKIAIIYGNGESFFMTGKEHFLEGLIERINCENIVTQIDSKASKKKSVPFSLEQLLLLNPDVILILPSSQTKNGEVFKESFDKNTAWKYTNAYKNNKIEIIDPTLFRMSAGVNSIDALEELYKYVYEK